jgi:uncharacterized membrane protein
MSRELRWTLVAVGALTVLALGLRLALMRDSLLGDELFMFNIVHGRSLGQAMSIVRETEKTPPLFFIFTWLTAKLGDPTYWIRLPSLVFGTALVPLGYALGARTVSRAAGLVAAAMLTLNAFAIFYGTEARSYTAVAFLAGLSTLCLLEALRTGKRWWWVAYGVAVLAVLYTHYTGAFVVIMQAAWAMWTHRERLRSLIIVNGLVVLAYLPWLPSFLLQEKHSADEARRIALYQPASWHLLGKMILQLLFGHPFVPLTHLPGTLATVVGLAVILAAIAAAAGRAWRAHERPRLSSPVTLVALLAVATPIGVGIVSLRPNMSFMIARNLIASLVPAAVLMGWLLTSPRRWLAVSATVVLLGVIGIGTVVGFESSSRRTPYRDVAHFIDAHSRTGDPVIQQFFVPVLGPLRNVVLINLSHRRDIFTTPAGAAGAWAQGRRGADVFLVQDLPGIFRSVQQLPPRTGPGNQFVRVAEHRYVGLDTAIVAEYRYHG